MKDKEVVMCATSSTGMSIKTWILILICLQNAGYSLIRKYSVANENVSSKEILIVAEFLKLFISIYMTLNDTDESDAEGKGLAKLGWLLKNSGRMFVLAAIYGAMNILSFVALEYIGAGEFTICAQLKILSTAGFSVLILGTSLSAAKWRALILLVLGCLLVASPSFTNDVPSKSDSVYLQLLGYIAVLTEVLMSGFASIYFEKVVKSTQEVVTIWERNFQLGVYSILIYGAIIVYENLFPAIGATAPRAIFSNWTGITFLVCCLGGFGGLLVAATLKYADAILKTLAAAGAIVLSTVLGHYLLDGPLNTVVSIGAAIVCISILNYAMDNSMK
jgi:UDP-sugar transporter A1/2/3